MIQKGRTSKKVSESNQSLSVSSPREVTVYLRSWSIDDALELELDEEGTRISLTIVDTPGFGDQIDNEARSANSYPPEYTCKC